MSREIYLGEVTRKVLFDLHLFAQPLREAREKVRSNEHTRANWLLCIRHLIDMKVKIEQIADELNFPSRGNGLFATFLRHLCCKVDAMLSDFSRPCPDIEEVLDSDSDNLRWVLYEAGVIGNNLLLIDAELNRGIFTTLLKPQFQNTIEWKFKHLVERASTWWIDEVDMRVYRRGRRKLSQTKLVGGVNQQSTALIREGGTLVLQAFIECEAVRDVALEGVVLDVCRGDVNDVSTKMLPVLADRWLRLRASNATDSNEWPTMPSDDHSSAALSRYCGELAAVMVQLENAIFNHDLTAQHQSDLRQRLSWKSDAGMLFLDNQVVRKVKRDAELVRAIYGSFESQNWPHFIAYPIPGHPKIRSSIKDAVASANAGIRDDHLSFHAKDDNKISCEVSKPA